MLIKSKAGQGRALSIPVLGSLKQKDPEFKLTLGYIDKLKAGLDYIVRP